MNIRVLFGSSLSPQHSTPQPTANEDNKMSANNCYKFLLKFVLKHLTLTRILHLIVAKGIILVH